MILNNQEIQHYVDRYNMIEGCSNTSIKNSSYKIRVDVLIEPETGNIITITNEKSFLLQPSKIILFQSIEKINLPNDVTASYSALYSIASKGALLINASMIEAGYSGKLSGVLANFSSNPIKIGFKEEIAKINFFKLNETPCVKKELIKDEDYINGLRKNAENYYKSFLNIKGIEANIETTIYKKVRNLLTTSGVILTVLILFSTIEPLLSRWIFEKTGVISTSEQISIQNSLIETNILLKENINNGKLELQKIQSQIDSIKQSIK